MKHSLRKSVALVISMMLIVTFAVAPIDSYAASKMVKSTTYSNTLKSGSFVYCTNGNKLFKVNLRTGKVKTMCKAKVGYITNLKIKNKYIYFNEMSLGTTGGRLNRISLKSGKKQVLAKNNVYPKYAIKGKKIYYEYSKVSKNGSKVTRHKRVMNLNGKKKKSTKVKIKMNSKLTNAKGYMVDSDFDYASYDWGNFEPVNYFLKTPSRTYYLETTKGPVS